MTAAAAWTSPPSLLVFDLDGTLIDSRQDLANSVNATLGQFGRAPLPGETIADYIGDGAPALVRRALAHEGLEPGPQLQHDALSFFLTYYRAHKLDFTYVYDGVFDALATIRARHPALPMAVLTNKPVGPSHAICTHFGFDRFFFAVHGGDSFATKKPAPEGLLTVIAQAATLTGTAILPADTVMIGDSHVDVETARAADTRALGCRFGLSPATLAAAGPDASVDHAAEWPRALGL